MLLNKIVASRADHKATLSKLDKLIIKQFGDYSVHKFIAVCTTLFQKGLPSGTTGGRLLSACSQEQAQN